MIVWVILIIFAIIVLFILWWFSGSEVEESSHYPTVHARCRSDSACGGDLVCDLHCNRCRKKIGGDCSGDNDCESGLRCHNWKCSPDDSNYTAETPKDSMKSNKGPVKGVRWNDTKNEIHYF